MNCNLNVDLTWASNDDDMIQEWKSEYIVTVDSYNWKHEVYRIDSI